MTWTSTRVWLFCAALAGLTASPGVGQSNPGSPSQQNAATLAPLLPLVQQLQKAIQAGDIDTSATLTGQLNSAVLAAHKKVYSHEVLLGRMEEMLREHPGMRPSRIAYLAMTAMWAKDYAKAKAYAAEALASAGPGSQNAAQNAYYGNEVLGMVELNNGDLALARQHLLLSVAGRGWSLLEKYGPNTTLAKALLARGEQDAVLEFLERSKALWPGGRERLTEWQAMIRAGATPDFGSTTAMLP